MVLDAVIISFVSSINKCVTLKLLNVCFRAVSQLTILIIVSIYNRFVSSFHNDDNSFLFSSPKPKVEIRK